MEKLCPLLQKPCIEHQCKFWVHLLGQNPQTSKAIDHWDCTLVWLPILLIENAQQGRQAGAAVESMRNEIVKRMDNPAQFSDGSQLALPPS
jgi:hypothetical protein